MKPASSIFAILMIVYYYYNYVFFIVPDRFIVHIENKQYKATERTAPTYWMI